MDFVVVLAAVLAVVLVVSAPLRARGRAPGAPESGEASAVAELEAAKDAKYREIRDAELDYRTGKLSEEDYRALDAGLRGEAVELLRRLDGVRGEPPAVR